MTVKSKTSKPVRLLLLALTALTLLMAAPASSQAADYGFRPCGDDDNPFGLRQWGYIGQQMYGLRAECDGAFYQYLQLPVSSENGPGIRWLPLGPGALTNVHFIVAGRDLQSQGLDLAMAICNGPDFPDDCGTQVRGATDYPYMPRAIDLSLENGDFPADADRLVLYGECTLNAPEYCEVGLPHVEFYGFYISADDPSPPDVEVSLPPSSTKWFNYVPDPAIAAYDPESGIDHSLITANGVTRNVGICGELFDADWGCPGSADVFDPTAVSLVQGRNNVSVDTFNAASLHASRSFNFLYDNRAPSVPAALSVKDMKNGWVAGHNLRLDWLNTGESLPTTKASGIASATVRLEPEDESEPGLYPQTLNFDGVGLTSATVTLPWDGRWTIRVRVTDDAGNVSDYSSIEVRLESDPPSPPYLVSGDVPPVINIATASSPVVIKWRLSVLSPSGECGYRGWIGIGTPPDLAADASAQVSSGQVHSWTIGLVGLARLSDGLNKVALAAVDCAGQVSQNALAPVIVDRVRPEVSLGTNARWLAAGESLSLNALDPGAPDDGSGLQSIWYRIGDEPAVFASLTSVMPVPLSLGRHSLRYGAIDRAGNPSLEHATTIGVDPDAPTATIEPNSSIPGGFTARVSDSISGVVDAWVEIAPAGGDEWRRIGDRFRSNSGELSQVVLGLRVPDDGSFAAGDYKLRVVASDEAGNVEVAAPRSIHLPLRPATSLSASIASVTHPKATHKSITLDVGERAVLSGVLRDSSGSAIAGAQLRVVAQRDSGGGKRVLGGATTGADGGYSFELGTDVSRSLTVYYDGSAERAPAATVTHEYTRAAVSMQLSPKRPRRGGRLFASGRVARLSAAVPATGIPVQIQFCGRVKCTTLGVQGYTDSSGGYSLAIPTRYSARTKLVLRARVGTFPGWPFAEGFSKRKSVVVR